VARADATFAALETELEGQLHGASAILRGGGTVIAEFFENAEREVAQQQADADTAMQHVLDRLRAGQLSRKQLAGLAREILAQLGELENAIRDTRATHEADACKVEEWIRLVAIANEHGRADLAQAARDRVEYWRRNTSARAAALHELLEFQDRLGEAGRLVLAAAG
jgi:hypothetical protein